ncbi:MAG: lysophospholipid acyltransferase family protein [Acinetobacter faecalis]|uniref:Lysophospholipid acyltransferase family protein n=1 Tax=Acinetobacter faecalis TaxID=2665161 RepID=A0ABU5GIG5_9GAMM|nr:lysophospholipid acyltransferase family protein [Acinetobacter faecalis]MDY6509624.1 lysophospholipid acyltransferase family protein [Acinetobacter faecalis]MDY6550308.1 lysophospholipid acyltransferase family protein [Acinetobacter faecalis]
MYLFLILFSKLPLKLIQQFAKKIGAFLYISNSSALKTTRNNIDIAFPHLEERDKESLVLSSLKSQCMTYSESIKIWGASTQFSLDQIKNVHGLDIFLEALQNPNGTLAAVPHFGTWEIMNAWVNQYTSPFIMYKPDKNEALNKFVLKARQRLNATLVPTDESGVRALFKHIKQGGFSAILPDHVPKESGGIYSPFFNINTLTSTLFSKLAAKTQCSVIGMYCLRRDDLSGFDLYINDLSKDILSKDLQQSVNTLNKEIEQIILSAPEQYLWGYKRFRKSIPT